MAVLDPVSAPDPSSEPTPSSVDKAAAPSNSFQWLSTSSSRPEYPAVSAPCCLSSTIERPFGMISLVQTRSTRDCPNDTPLSYRPIKRVPVPSGYRRHSQLPEPFSPAADI